MRHIRSDYDSIQPWPVKRPHTARMNGEIRARLSEADVDSGKVTPLIPDDEPVLILRGQDPAAAKAVRSYIRYAAQEGASEEFLSALDNWAEQMADWAERIGHGAPDVPEGMLRFS